MARDGPPLACKPMAAPATRPGPGTGTWQQITAGGEKLRVHRRFYKDLDIADAALTAV